MSVRNHIAKDLRTPKYRQQVVLPKKGRGSFSRKTKHKVDTGETA